MRTFKLLALALGAVALMALLIGCGAEQSQTETTTQETAQPTMDTPETAQAKPYPLDYCIISGEELGTMGDPVVKTYQGQEVKFCCKMCIPEFESNVAMYIAKIDSAAAGTMDMDMPGHEGHDHGEGG